MDADKIFEQVDTGLVKVSSSSGDSSCSNRWYFVHFAFNKVFCGRLEVVKETKKQIKVAGERNTGYLSTISKSDPRLHSSFSEAIDWGISQLIRKEQSAIEELESIREQIEYLKSR